MPLADVADQYFTFESRLDSFQTAQPLLKRRTSNANPKTPKSIKWPHQFLSGEELAKAGFFYYPTQANQDNVCCFLCHKSLDGWEEDDDPLAEHLKHSAACGWAIVAEIERHDGNFSDEDPTSTSMADARRATFGDKWPHENKKGWKCKVKQLVEAGWKYTPTPEYDDTTTCTYCSLALDGWEPSDKPLDEHYKRSPDCPFFTLGKQNPSARKAKTKKDRTSKSSRLSTQSTFTAASEAPSLADLPLDEDDSVLTVGTSAPATPAEKKMEKKKRITTAKARKTKAKKSEAVEVPPVVEVEDNDVEDKEVPAPKATRGRKRKSEQIQDSTTDVVEAEAPAPKRRATRTRGSAAVEDITLPSAEQNVPQTNTDEPSSSTGRSRAKSVAKTARKPSTRVASRKIQAPPPPTDEELDAALQADLERHASDDEKMPVIVPSKKATKSSKVAKADHAMFDPEPMDIDEVAIEAELEAMEAESKPLPKPKAARGRPRKASAKQQAATKKPVEDETEAREAVDELASQAVDELASDQIATELEVSILQRSPPALKPKKQRAASRKVSKPVPARGTGPPILSVHDNSIIQTDDLQSWMVDQKKDDHDEQNDDFGNDTNLSMASQSTVVRTSTSTHRDSTVKRKRGRPSKQEVASRNIEEIVQTSFSSTPNNDIDELVDPPVSVEEASPDEISRTEERFYTPAPEFYQEEEKSVPEVIRPQPARQVGRPPKAAREPMAIISTPLPPKDENRSPSPQSSDVENQPPSSKPSTAKKSATPKPISTRVPLAPTTPAMSPSKHNVISCLQSANPWTAVDLDTIFLRTPRDENAMAKGLFDDALAKVKNSELTSPEKKMSVEEWILYNAEVAEEKLRNECERMVGLFEREGTRAMAALEGVECTE